MDRSSSRSNDISGGRRVRGPSLLRSLAYAACIALSVSLVIVATSSTPNALAAPVPIAQARAATPAQQREILTAVINAHQPERFATFDANGTRQRLALEDATVAICGTPRPSGVYCTKVPSDLSTRSPEVPDALLEALPRFNDGRHPLEVRTLPGIIPVERKRIAAIFKEGFWPEFYQAYPQASGILRVSRAVVSAGGDQALLYVATSRGGLDGSGGLELLALERGQWKIVGYVGLWVS